jgi:hypothetical protein
LLSGAGLGISSLGHSARRKSHPHVSGDPEEPRDAEHVAQNPLRTFRAADRTDHGRARHYGPGPVRFGRAVRRTRRITEVEANPAKRHAVHQRGVPGQRARVTNVSAMLSELDRFKLDTRASNERATREFVEAVGGDRRGCRARRSRSRAFASPTCAWATHLSSNWADRLDEKVRADTRFVSLLARQFELATSKKERHADLHRSRSRQAPGPEVPSQNHHQHTGRFPRGTRHPAPLSAAGPSEFLNRLSSPRAGGRLRGWSRASRFLALGGPGSMPQTHDDTGPDFVSKPLHLRGNVALRSHQAATLIILSKAHSPPRWSTGAGVAISARSSSF